MKQKLFGLIATILFCGSLNAQNVPNAAEFLSGPPAGNSMQYIKDYFQYIWGKSQRDTDRGKQAESDFQTEISTYLKAYSDVLGVDLTSNMPKINILFDYCMTYGIQTQTKAQEAFFSRRPYARFNESSLIPSQESNYRNSSSYPASQALFGWMYAMILTEIAPNLQDEILERGYGFGASSVISGYHWDSDIYAGFLLASALVARLHTHSGFNGMVTAARSEYEAKSGVHNPTSGGNENVYFTNDELPDGYKYLPLPPDSLSAFFACDMSAHQDGIVTRTDPAQKEAAQTALNDIEYSVDNFCSVYSPYFGKEISASATPQIYKLMDRVHPSGNGATQSTKAHYMRLRPYVRMNEGTAYPPDEDELRYTGSYPSGHASGSWLHALVLAEINPDAEEELLARAYQFGQGRVITGYHWQSDVDMGRLIASAVYARLHTSTEFMEQIERAKQEYKGGSAIRSVKADDENAQIYTLEGIPVEGQPRQSGIYIQGNKKVAY